VIRATPEDDQRIQALWEQKKSLTLSGKYDESLSIAEKFHLALAQATHSSAVVHMVANVVIVDLNRILRYT